jgi:hypothetical protein
MSMKSVKRAKSEIKSDKGSDKGKETADGVTEEPKNDTPYIRDFELPEDKVDPVLKPSSPEVIATADGPP